MNYLQNSEMLERSMTFVEYGVTLLVVVFVVRLIARIID